MRQVLGILLLTVGLHGEQRRLLVISVDGLDARYLNNAASLGLRIPHLRRLAAEGLAADGMVGIVPTVTWPSHTTLITGVTAEEHGIPTNDQPGQPGQRWWFPHFLKRRTLWQAAMDKKLKTATVYWPVTTGAEVTFNFPEFWEKRPGNEVYFEPIARRSTPGLAERVAKAYPAFVQTQWTDRSAMTAVRYLLEFEKPDLTLVHIADLDEEEHEKGAFTKEAKSVLESQDQLIGWALEKLPPKTSVAIVSDHGFENAGRVLRPEVMLQQAGVQGAIAISNGLIGTPDPPVAEFLRSKIGEANGIAREVPMAEVKRFAPSLLGWVAAFETSSGCVPAAGRNGPAISEGSHKGLHGLWPTRASYRAVFMIRGEGIKKGGLGEISMLDVAPTFAELLGVELPQASGKSFWKRLQ